MMVRSNNKKNQRTSAEQKIIKNALENKLIDDVKRVNTVCKLVASATNVCEEFMNNKCTVNTFEYIYIALQN